MNAKWLFYFSSSSFLLQSDDEIKKYLMDESLTEFERVKAILKNGDDAQKSAVYTALKDYFRWHHSDAKIIVDLLIVSEQKLLTHSLLLIYILLLIFILLLLFSPSPSPSPSERSQETRSRDINSCRGVFERASLS